MAARELAHPPSHRPAVDRRSQRRHRRRPPRIAREAFQACRYAIERVKQIAPVWKHEFFEDGDAWVEGADADVDDEAARRRALERGMRVTVQVFARLARAGRPMPNGSARCRPARRSATSGRQSAGAIRRSRPSSRSVSCARNEDFARMTAPVQDGDDIAFLPPVSGGAASDAS